MKDKKIKQELKKRYLYSRKIFYILLGLIVVLTLVDIGLYLIFKAVKKENTIKVNLQGVSSEESKELEDFLNQK